MQGKCDFCGVNITGNTKYCSECEKLFNQRKISEVILSDFKKSQKPNDIKKVSEIRQILSYAKKKKTIKWDKLKRLSCLLLILNIVLFYTILLVGSRIGIPVHIIHTFWTASFIVSFVLVCIYGSMRLGYRDQVESGFTNMISNDYEKSVKNYIKALKRDSEDINSWRGLSYLYFSVKEYEEAIEACKIGLGIEPNDKILWWILALSHHISGNELEAKKAEDILEKLGVNEGISVEISNTKPFFRIRKL